MLYDKKLKMLKEAYEQMMEEYPFMLDTGSMKVSVKELDRKVDGEKGQREYPDSPAVEGWYLETRKIQVLIEGPIIDAEGKGRVFDYSLESLDKFQDQFIKDFNDLGTTVQEDILKAAGYESWEVEPIRSSEDADMSLNGATVRINLLLTVSSEDAPEVDFQEPDNY